MKKYVVKNENTLGYVHEGQPRLMGVLAGIVALGGHDPKNGYVVISKTDTIREALSSDFERFRVCSKGHIA